MCASQGIHPPGAPVLCFIWFGTLKNTILLFFKKQHQYPILQGNHIVDRSGIRRIFDGMTLLNIKEIQWRKIYGKAFRPYFITAVDGDGIVRSVSPLILRLAGLESLGQIVSPMRLVIPLDGTVFSVKWTVLCFLIKNKWSNKKFGPLVIRQKKKKKGSCFVHNGTSLLETGQLLSHSFPYSVGVC